MTAWDNFLFSLIVLFLIPFVVLLISFGVSKLVQFWLPSSQSHRDSRPKSVREPIHPPTEPMGLQQAS